MKQILLILIFLCPLVGYSLAVDVIVENYIFFNGIILNKTANEVYHNILRDYYITNFDSVSIVNKESRQKSIITRKGNLLSVTIMKLSGKKIQKHTIIFTKDSISEKIYSYIDKSSFRHPALATIYFYEDSINYIQKEFLYSAYRKTFTETLFINNSKKIAITNQYIYDTILSYVMVTPGYFRYYKSDTSDNVIIGSTFGKYTKHMKGKNTSKTIYVKKSDFAIITVDTIDNSRLKLIYTDITNPQSDNKFECKIDLKTKDLISYFTDQYSYSYLYSPEGKILRKYLRIGHFMNFIYLCFYEDNTIRIYRTRKTKRNKLKGVKLVKDIKCYNTVS